jgi:large subunit ribosomal protein L25
VSGDRIQLTVKQRESLGSAESRRLRRDGFIPGVLYGNGEPRAIAVEERALRNALTGGSGLHAVLDIVVGGDGGSTHPSILKEYQQDALRGRVIHVDLQEVRLDRVIQASLVVELVGGEDAPGVKEGGVLSQVSREINVEALPMEIPERIELDVSGMQLNDTLRLVDLPAREGVAYLDDPEETVLATVTMPTRVEEPEEAVAEGEEGALEGVPGEERPEGAAEGEAAPDADAGGDSGEPGTAAG